MTVDNGNSHGGARCEARFIERRAQIRVAHTPTRASWLSQVGFDFCALRKALEPNEWRSPIATSTVRSLRSHRSLGPHETRVPGI